MLNSTEHYISTVHNIRIYLKCGGRVEKSVPMIAVWNHEACRVMTNGYLEGRIFLSYPHTNNGFFFFLLTTIFIYLFIYLVEKIEESPYFKTLRP